MKFFLKRDLNEERLREQFALEVNFVRKALKAVRENEDLTLHGTLSNLYHVSRRYEYPYFYELIASISRENKIDILDVGCGTSYAPDAFSVFCNSYTALDIIDFGPFWASVNNNILFLQHDITSTPPPSFQFGYDLVLSISVLEHIPKGSRKAALLNCIKSIRKGGVLALTFDVDIEGSGNGLTFDELIDLIDFIENNEMSTMAKIDLTTYQDLLTTEDLIGLPINRYQLPWRISKTHQPRSLLQKLIDRVFLQEQQIPKGASLAVAYGSFCKK